MTEHDARKHLSCKLIVPAVFCCLLIPSFTVEGQTSSRHVPLGIVSDWTHHHALYPESTNASVMARFQNDPRWVQNWYLRHRERWWPGHHPERPNARDRRDWSVPLGTTNFGPQFNGAFTFAIGPDTGYGNLNTTNQGDGSLLAISGTLTVTGGQDVGTYLLYPGGPGQTTSPSGFFLYDNLVFPSTDPGIDNNGFLFATASDFEVNIFSNGPDSYQFYDNSGYNNVGTSLNLNYAPGGGQTFPAKYVFDVTAAPSCTNDFVVIGIPASPASGGQANILGMNNLYSNSTSTGYCPGTGPNVMFAYASGSGQVPDSVVLSQSGQQVAYVENLSGSSYFHVLTMGTTGTNGTNATAAVVPGSAGGNNAVDQTVLLSPDGGTTNQSSTSSAYVVYTANDANDVAYVTTYSAAGTGSGYVYKIDNVFNGSAPTIVWSVPINAIPSTPIYDQVSNKVFFTDSNGRIDYVLDSGSPSVVYGSVVASGTTSENAVIVDSTNQMVYSFFNSNGTNAMVVQAPTTLASTVSAPVGTANTTYTGPYLPDFNNAWYTGTGTPKMYVAGTGTGTLPTLYSIGFDGSGVMNSSADATTAALATGTADSSPLTAFYNASLQQDFLFVGVTDNCIATGQGGTSGCVMSLDITNGFPTVNASTAALPAAGGASGIIFDNDSDVAEGSSIYYATASGATLVKATQSGLN